MFVTLPKILLTVAVIAVLWWWFRRNQVKARERDALNRNQRAGASKSKGAAASIEDMAQCKVCGAYVPAKSASRCGRDNCPI